MCCTCLSPPFVSQLRPHAAARFRSELFQMINANHTLYEIVSGKVKIQPKPRTGKMQNHPMQGANKFSKKPIPGNQKPEPKDPEPEGEDDDFDYDDGEGDPCPSCGGFYRCWTFSALNNAFQCNANSIMFDNGSCHDDGIWNLISNFPRTTGKTNFGLHVTCAKHGTTASVSR